MNCYVLAFFKQVLQFRVPASNFFSHYSLKQCSKVAKAGILHLLGFLAIETIKG